MSNSIELKIPLKVKIVLIYSIGNGTKCSEFVMATALKKFLESQGNMERQRTTLEMPQVTFLETKEE